MNNLLEEISIQENNILNIHTINFKVTKTNNPDGIHTFCNNFQQHQHQQE